VPKVTLTFDNGPDPNVTPYVLDCLARHDVKSTFFVIGRRVAEPARTAVAREAAKAGHRIGNHTWSHTTPLGELDAAGALDEFERAEQALDFLVQPMRLFRPYGRGGKLGTHMLKAAVVPKLDTCVLWKFVSGDWRDPDGWMARALADCRASEWSLVVLHDIPSGAMLHLDTFIRALKQEGMELTQEYPPDCVPIANGKIVLPIEPYCSSGILT
jgi:peptidoglycan/xylan/chitin deacetylase (PgdA/CDA1 family)